jgi:hypothetical protein
MSRTSSMTLEGIFILTKDCSPVKLGTRVLPKYPLSDNFVAMHKFDIIYSLQRWASHVHKMSLFKWDLVDGSQGDQTV